MIYLNKKKLYRVKKSPFVTCHVPMHSIPICETSSKRPRSSNQFNGSSPYLTPGLPPSPFSPFSIVSSWDYLRRPISGCWIDFISCANQPNANNNLSTVSVLISVCATGVRRETKVSYISHRVVTVCNDEDNNDSIYRNTVLGKGTCCNSDRNSRIFVILIL